MTPPISWDPVRTYIAGLPVPQRFTTIVAGTAEWCQLDDHDPRKLAAVITAGSRWALDTQLAQREVEWRTEADATAAMAAEIPWTDLVRKINERNRFERETGTVRRSA